MNTTSCPQCSKPYGRRKRCYWCNGPKKRTGQERSCKQCGNPFYVQSNVAADIRRNSGQFCSIACKVASMKGRSFKADGVTRYPRKRDGYILVKTGIHSWALEHRLVMEQKIGRKLTRNDHVHHINKIKADNRPENLQLLTNSEHWSLHHPKLEKRNGNDQ